MRGRSTILTVIAVACGLVALLIGVSRYNVPISNGQSVRTEWIFVAANDISAGENLDAQNVMLAEWPIDRIPECAVFELEQLVRHPVLIFG